MKRTRSIWVYQCWGRNATSTGRCLLQLLNMLQVFPNPCNNMINKSTQNLALIIINVKKDLGGQKGKILEVLLVFFFVLFSFLVLCQNCHSIMFLNGTPTIKSALISPIRWIILFFNRCHSCNVFEQELCAILFFWGHKLWSQIK